MSAASADRNLLFGILAVQNDFVTRDALIAAMNAWMLDKGKPLGQILVDLGSLAQDDADAIEVLIRRHIAKNGGDVARSLRAVSSAERVAETFIAIDDPDIRQSLMILGVAPPQAPASDGVELSDPPNGSEGDQDHSRKKRPEGGWKAGRFRVIAELGGGGMGKVYEAYDDEELGRRVALKMVREEEIFSESRLKHYQNKLRKEGEINGNLEHPNIIPVYGLGTTDDGKPFYAMRYIDSKVNLHLAIANFHSGRPLLDESKAENPDAPTMVVPPSSSSAPAAVRFDRLSSERNVDFRQLLERFTDICDAIDYAHSRRVLHRDLKPGNVMLGKHGETLVIDWGLAKTRADIQAEIRGDSPVETLHVDADANDRRTLAGQAQGTPGYMAPEQLAGDLTKINERTDIFSLGAILYQLMTNQIPFLTPDIRAIQNDIERLKRLSEAIATGSSDPRTLNPTVPKPLAAICSKALAADPAKRYKSAAALAKDVEQWLADEPVTACRENIAERARRWGRMNRGAIKALICLSPVTLVAFGGSLYAFALHQYSARLKAEHMIAEIRAESAEQREAQSIFARNQQRNADLRARVKLAMSRGAWEEAIDSLSVLENQINESVLLNKDDWIIDLKLDRIESLNNSGRYFDALTLVKSLEFEYRDKPEKFTSLQRGRLMVRKGDLMLEPLKFGEVSPYDLALSEDLPLSERFYVKALQEPDPGKAIQLFKKSLEQNPFHMRAVYLSIILNLLSGNSTTANDLETLKRILPVDGFLLVFELFSNNLIHNTPIDNDEVKELEAAFDPAVARLILDTLDLPSRAESVKMPELMTISRRLIKEIDVGEPKSGIGILNFLYAHPPAAFNPIREALQSMINYPIHFTARMQGGGIALKLLAGQLRGMLKIPVKNREQRIEAYRNALKVFPISVFALALGLEHLEAGQIEQAAEAFANMPENDALHEDHRSLMSATSNLALHFAELILGRMRKSLPVLGPGGVIDEATAKHVRKLVERIHREPTALTDYELALVAQLITYIEDPELGVLFFENQQRIKPNPYNISLSRFFRALGNPYDAIEYLKSGSGGIQGDTRSALWIRLHRDHPELAGAYPFLNEMPENPFMPTNLDHPIPPWFGVPSPTTLVPASSTTRPPS